MTTDTVESGFWRRIAYWKHGLWKPVGWVASAVVTLYWAAEFARDEFLSPELQERFRLLSVIHRWQWRTWLIVLLATVLVSVLEGSYRFWVLTNENMSAQSKLDRERFEMEVSIVENKLSAANQSIVELESRLIDEAPKVIAEPAVVAVPGSSLRVPGFKLKNTGKTIAMNVEIQGISIANYAARFEAITQLASGNEKSIFATVEVGGVISPLFRFDLNRVFQAARPSDLNIESGHFPLRISYGDMANKHELETEYEMEYNFFTSNLQLKFIRYGRVSK
jgi:hypothetical protein